jgi:hypothetical protein
MKIAQISGEFKIFFNRFRELFSLRQYYYFRIYVYSLIISEPEYKSVNRMSQVWVGSVCRSSLERFLCGMKWEFEKVTRRACKQIMNIISQREEKQKFSGFCRTSGSNIGSFGRRVADSHRFPYLCKRRGMRIHPNEV